MTRHIDGRVRDWRRNRDMWVRILEKQTEEDLDAWKRRIKQKRLTDERSLRAWLTRQGVLGTPNRSSSWSDSATRISYSPQPMN